MRSSQARRVGGRGSNDLARNTGGFQRRAKLLGRVSHRWFPILLCGVIFGFYLGFPTRSYHWDGVLFSLRIEQAHPRYGRTPR